MKFTKMHGLGNDYVFVDCLEQNLENASGVAKKISRRHFSVGSDGLILILPSKKADFKMKMYNADGSTGSMCGNGIRCLGKYVYEHGKTKKTSLYIETDAGVRSLELNVKENRVCTVRVDMGTPDFVPEHIPCKMPNGIMGCPAGIPCKMPNGIITADSKTFLINCLSVGNPHCVIFQKNIDTFDLEHFGPILEKHPFFPNRINVEIAEIIKNNEIKMRVWERGSGETCACGTGACAVLAAAFQNSLCGRTATIHLPGGDLEVEWQEKDDHIYLTGPAEEVYTGVLAAAWSNAKHSSTDHACDPPEDLSQ